MKKFSKILLVVLCAIMVSLPFVARADEETSSSADVGERSKIPVYMFRGDGCGFCANALTFFEEIQDEYGQYFELKTFEVFNDASNQALMDEVAEYLDIQISGVPFIIIGEETFGGFDDEFKETIKEEILAEYNRSDEDRTDIIKAVQNGEAKKTNVVGEVITVLVAVGLVAFIVFAKKSVNAKKNNSHTRITNIESEGNEEKIGEDDYEEEKRPVKAKKEEHVVKEKATSSKKKDDKLTKNSKEKTTSKKENNKTSKTTKKNNKK